jgi:protein-L-isoaspartate(D-aspartate) O-methyltransferase
MRSTEDSYLHKGMRKTLIEEIGRKGIRNQRVLEAIQSVPRHFFLDSAFTKKAYEDRAFPIGEGQTISQPYTVAYQSELLDPRPYEKVLEIGTGSAYQACILASMGAQVFTIERQKSLYDSNRKFDFLKTFPGIKFFYGDGFKGLPTYAPFDKVIVTAAAPHVPQDLIDQLRTGGVLVIPVDEGALQRMMRLTKLEDGSFTEERFDLFSFVPMLQGKNME